MRQPGQTTTSQLCLEDEERLDRHLGRVILIREPVPHGYARIARKFVLRRSRF